MKQYFEMGGYAAFVWPAYAVTLAAIVLNIVWARRPLARSREGAGVVAHGHMRPDGTFVADEVLVKHDEKYMPPAVARSLKRRHGQSRADATAAPTPGAPAPRAPPSSAGT